MPEHDLRCICGSHAFTARTTTYQPAAKLTGRLRGRVDATVSGVCTSCSTHVTTTVYNTHRRQEVSS